MSEPSSTQIDTSDAARVASVSFRYPDGTEALDGVSLGFAAGRLSAVVGANGSGKSTLLRLLAGTLEPSAGAVRVFQKAPAVALTETTPRVAYAPQRAALDPELTGAETLELFEALHAVPRGERRGRRRALVKLLGLSGQLDRLVGTYSGGLKRRLSLALSLVCDPDLWMLDEPDSGLDPDTRFNLWKHLDERSASGRTSIVATHDLERVAAHCSTMALFDRGRLLALGAPDELVAREREAAGADGSADLMWLYTRLTGRAASQLGAHDSGARRPRASA